MNADDLLSFKEYSPVHENHVLSGHAEININSPTRQTNSDFSRQSPRSAPNDFMNDFMQTGASVNVLHDEDRQMRINSPLGMYAVDHELR